MIYFPNIFYIFQTTHQYFTKASPAKPGDYIEFIADMDLIVALSACPHGQFYFLVFFAHCLEATERFLGRVYPIRNNK